MILLLLFACSSEEKTYDLSTIKDDISGFTEGEQITLAEFSDTYESEKSYQDGVHGVAVKEVPNLTYREIIDKVMAWKVRAVAQEDLALYQKVRNDADSTYTLSHQFKSVHVWLVDSEFMTRNHIEMGEGRGFSQTEGEATDIIVSQNMFQEFSLEMDETITLDHGESAFQTHRVIGVYTPFSQRDSEELLLLQLK